MAIGQAPPEEDPPWMYSFDDGRLAALGGSCYRQLGKLTAAERTLREALEALDVSCTRRRSEALLELALVQLEKEDIDQACRFATQSYAAAVEAGSVLGQRGSGRSARGLTAGAMPRPCGASMSSSLGCSNLPYGRVDLATAPQPG